MEKQSPSLVRHPHNGVIKLPPGFRFHPTDEELVVQYLRRKAFSFPLPASIIPDIDLARYNPWDLPGGCEQEMYFFALREAKYPKGNRSNRATGCGYWKATGKDRAIVATKIQQVVGMKKTLVFYRGKAPSGSRTDWVMHEYRLAIAEAAPQRKDPTHVSKQASQSLQRADVVRTGDWVLCRIFLKKRSTNDEERRDIGLIDFMGRRPSSPSGSDSSCVTEATDESGHGEDAASAP